jgi:hypothetical protein
VEEIQVTFIVEEFDDAIFRCKIRSYALESMALFKIECVYFS